MKTHVMLLLLNTTVAATLSATQTRRWLLSFIAAQKELLVYDVMKRQQELRLDAVRFRCYT